jgi:Vitamin K-dependent gamma-carboxylase
MSRLAAPRDRFFAAWERFWFAEIPTSTYALFRIAFGILTFAWALSLAPSVFAFYSKDGILPVRPDYNSRFDWSVFDLFPGDLAVAIVYFLLYIAALMLIVGFRSRLAAFVVFVCLISFGRRNPWVLNSGDLLVFVLSFYAMLMPSGEWLSVDRWLRDRGRFWELGTRAIWPLRLVQVQISVLYLAAVWAKVRGTTWNDGTAVSYAFRMADLERFPVPGFVTDTVLIANILTYGTLAVELSLGILVWNRVLRPWVLLLGVGLHLGIDYSTRVGFFSWAVLVAYIAFVPPERATALILGARDRLARPTLPSWIPLARRSE